MHLSRSALYFSSCSSIDLINDECWNVEICYGKLMGGLTGMSWKCTSPKGTKFFSPSPIGNALNFALQIQTIIPKDNGFAALFAKNQSSYLRSNTLSQWCTATNFCNTKLVMAQVFQSHMQKKLSSSSISHSSIILNQRFMNYTQPVTNEPNCYDVICIS